MIYHIVYVIMFNVSALENLKGE